jgi:hypothetical protein
MTSPDHDVIQGVRAYNSNASIWTTPDAYEGDIRDPIVAKALHVEQPKRQADRRVTFTNEEC